MSDVVLVLVVAAFIALCALYVVGCERIVREGEPVGGEAVPERTAR